MEIFSEFFRTEFGESFEAGFAGPFERALGPSFAQSVAPGAGSMFAQHGAMWFVPADQRARLGPLKRAAAELLQEGLSSAARHLALVRRAPKAGHRAERKQSRPMSAPTIFNCFSPQRRRQNEQPASGTSKTHEPFFLSPPGL